MATYRRPVVGVAHQGLGVVRAVGVGEVVDRAVDVAVAARRSAPVRPGTESRDSVLSPMSPTQTSLSSERGERLDVLRVVGPAGDADRLAGGRVDGEDPAGVAGVVGGDDQAVDDREPAGLDDVVVLEGEHHLRLVHRRRRPRRAGTVRRRGRPGPAQPWRREQLGQLRVDAPGRDQVVVLAPERAALDRRAGAGGAEQGVARGVLALDELHDVDAVALQSHQRGPQRVGQGVGQPLAEDAVPGEHGVRRGGRRLAELRGHVVVAAGGGQHQRGLPLDRAGQRLVGRGVTGVQGQHHLGRRVERRRRRCCRPRTSRPGRARRRPSRCARGTAP